MEESFNIVAYPVRIIPFDLGRTLNKKDLDDIGKLIYNNRYESIDLSSRQNSILKNCVVSFRIDNCLSAFVYLNGIMVFQINETPFNLDTHSRSFAIQYGENRKKAHSQLFKWEHEKSQEIKSVVMEFQTTIRANTKKGRLRESSEATFENNGLSYVMTLSLLDVGFQNFIASGFDKFPNWVKSNLLALLDPAYLYLEDSSKFESANDVDLDLEKILKELEVTDPPRDYERHRHIRVFMSWAAVLAIGHLQPTDFEEYSALEVQLQSDWFYIYCLEKHLDAQTTFNKQGIIDLQRENYELDVLQNRLYDFDDSSMPTRVLDIQRGLVETSQLGSNIEHLQRKVRYVLEREQLNAELKQKKLGQSTEILLFIIAFIEIAPIVAEFGEHLFPYAGAIANVIIIVIGIILLLRKN